MDNSRNWRLLMQLLLLTLGVILIPRPVEGRPPSVAGGMELQSNYLKAISAHRRLERILPKQELRALMGIGLLNGARQAEEQMEQHLVGSVRDLLLQMNITEGTRITSKIDAIEHQLSRDQKALDILTMAMDVLAKSKNDHDFRVELREMEHQQREEELFQQELSADLTAQPKLGERLGRLRKNILKQVPQMKLELDVKIEKALQHFLDEASADGVLAKAKQKVVHKRQATQRKKNKKERERERKEEQEREEELEREEEQERKEERDRVKEEEQGQEQAEQRQAPQEMRIIKSILSEAHELRFQDDFQENLLEQQQPERRVKMAANPSELDDLEMDIQKSPNITGRVMNKPNPAKQEEAAEAIAEGGSSELGEDNDDDEDGPPGGGGGGGGGGGLVGIIGSLSGGEGGSDVGALIGALTGLVSTLFGPGGLDVEGLIKTSTSLISGLLGGNKNFGLVLGQYVGTALDGLSGGGGAINNGQFLGNFLGTVVASLSADPDDEGPPQPLTFTKNLISSFLESKFRPDSEEGSEERHGSAELPRPRKKKEGGGGWTSAVTNNFDSGGFVKQVASHLVSNALGLLLNAGLGASGGASSAAKGIFASSSGGHAKPADHHRSWNPYDQPF
ncbi:hypothetical protein KR009_011498 [Drosophila setifemur]|nr:hypothetical protein KR009_011498 [Drosophila setifemur]